ncbi:hypothetical protein GCM10023095_09320 [Pseudaeromonas paramecii]|uniref:Uncharacterized protein n=1 Tax=Pseudaeromonas paramecii TaxID=2138166 RepID=A0ABP8Q0N3_9GAMM
MTNSSELLLEVPSDSWMNDTSKFCLETANRDDKALYGIMAQPTNVKAFISALQAYDNKYKNG